MKNVVLFTIDTLRRDMLGLYGSELGLTPFLDSLRSDALVFTLAHSVAPYTQASFPGILTSSYLFDAPKSQKLSKDRTLISEALKEKGVSTAAFHSNPYLSGYFGWNRGWDTFYDSMQDDVDDMNPYIKGDVLNQKIDAWLGRVDKDKPFFLWLHYMDVHEPYVPERRYVERVDASIELSPEQMFALFKKVLLPRDMSKIEAVAQMKKLYQAHVYEVDEYAKQLFGVLDNHGVLADSTVIVTTDHGDEFGDHEGLSHDGKMYAELVHVPQLIVNPPEGRGSQCDTLVSGLDIPPTVMNLFGFEDHPNFQGRSLLPLSKYPETGVYGEAIGKLSHKIKETDRPAYYYRNRDFKIMYREEDDRWELYNMQSDPQETRNIVDTSPSAEEMKAELKPRINREIKTT